MKGFSGFKDSPLNQNLPKDFNIKGSASSTTPGYSTTKGANKGLPKNFNTVGTSKAGKFAKYIPKISKFLGGKTLGVLGMMIGTTSKADQPKKGKGKIEYPGGKLDFTKNK